MCFKVQKLFLNKYKKIFAIVTIFQHFIYLLKTETILSSITGFSGASKQKNI